MANRLSTAKRALALQMLVEGMSMRAVHRTVGISLNTVYKLHADAGAAALAYHKRVARDLEVSLVQCDELWAFIYAKKKNVETALNPPPEAGDVWTWTALDVESKFMLAWEVGDRTARTAHRLMRNLRKRLDGNRIQLTTDGHSPYLKAVPRAFGDDIDYATLVKVFEANEDPSIDTRVVIGDPDPNHINTSYVERSNLSIRMGLRRFTRKSNGFSKRAKSHALSVSLYFLYHNFCWAHDSLNGMTPAQAMGLTAEKKDVEWIVSLIDARASTPNRPETYKKSRAMVRKQRARQISRVRARVRKAIEIA